MSRQRHLPSLSEDVPFPQELGLSTIKLQPDFTFEYDSHIICECSSWQHDQFGSHYQVRNIQLTYA